MKVEHRIAVNAAPQVIFSIYEKVDRWHEWDPDTQQASLYGPFQEGTRGKLTPTKGNTVPMLLTEVVPGACFTVVSKIPLFQLVFEHELHPAGIATEVVHRVTLSGPLLPLIGPMMKRRLNEGLPVTLARLKSLAESQA